MKELSIEEKAKRYDEAIKKARNIVNSINVGLIGKNSFEAVFPELKESEDERIRKRIIHALHGDVLELSEIKEAVDWLEKQGEQNLTLPKWKYKKDNTPLLRDSIILNKYGCVAKSPSGALVSDVWVLDYAELAKLPKEEIEKQGEQKPVEWHREDEQNLNACLGYIPDEFLRRWITDIIHVKYDKPVDKIEPKFKVGDWLVDEKGVVKQILSYKHGVYKHTCGYSARMFEDKWRMWDITKDAKDGDVLAVEPIEGYSSSFVAIYKKQNEEDFDSYCFVGFDGKFYKNEHGHSTENIHPATKEQRDLLFQKMHEAGYAFDFEKKELKTLKPQLKQEWSEEDENLFKSCITRMQMVDSDATLIDWLVSIKNRFQPKQEWSEEDRLHYANVLEALEYLKGCKSDYDKIEAIKSDIAWFKSLRHQNRCTYNPYKAVVESISEMCKHYDKTTDLQDFYDNVKVKCKDAKEYDSLFPQTTWKPSEEQMFALNIAIEMEDGNILKSLYQDLEKLS